jgi:hypothetical protein
VLGGDVGRYVTFSQADEQSVEYFHPVEAIEIHGLRTGVMSPVLVRIEMLLKARAY